MYETLTQSRSLAGKTCRLFTPSSHSSGFFSTDIPSPIFRLLRWFPGTRLSSSFYQYCVLFRDLSHIPVHQLTTRRLPTSEVFSWVVTRFKSISFGKLSFLRVNVRGLNESEACPRSYGKLLKKQKKKEVQLLWEIRDANWCRSTHCIPLSWYSVANLSTLSKTLFSRNLGFWNSAFVKIFTL